MEGGEFVSGLSPSPCFFGLGHADFCRHDRDAGIRHFGRECGVLELGAPTSAIQES